MTISSAVVCAVLAAAIQSVTVQPATPSKALDGVHRAARALDAGVQVGASYPRYLELTQQLATELLLARDLTLDAADHAALPHYDAALRAHLEARHQWKKAMDGGAAQMARIPNAEMRLSWREAALTTAMAQNVRSGRSANTGLAQTIAELERDRRQVTMETERATEAQRKVDSAEEARRAAAAVPVDGPRVVTKVTPAYPPIAQSARVQGTVILEVDVDADGTVRDARVLRSIPLLDQAAINAVRGYKYAPAMRAGVPVRGTITETVVFVLR